MKYEILLLGKTKSSFLAEGISEYAKRLKHYAQVKLKTIKLKNLQGTEDQIKEKEGEMLLANVPPATFLVTLDINGKQVSSTDLSEMIERWEITGTGHVTFVIGGPMGLADKVLQVARLSISLSRMTFTHDMARLLLVEQLYRAHTIKAGEKYHK